MVVELAALVLLLCYRDLAALAQGVLLFAAVAGEPQTLI